MSRLPLGWWWRQVLCLCFVSASDGLTTAAVLTINYCCCCCISAPSRLLVVACLCSASDNGGLTATNAFRIDCYCCCCCIEDHGGSGGAYFWFPIMSPYNLYKQKTSLTRSIRTLISTKRPLPKEYTQSSRLDQLILTLHGRKGLPVTARIALLETRFKQYQHAVIGTVLTTLHAGSVLLTFYPHFNLSLEDPNLPTTIKVQIQLQGADQTPTSKLATLHHQIVYRLQNHALDLPTPYTTSDALMMLADTDTIPTIIQIPNQIQKQELLKLMPLEWLTNYEHFHQNFEPVQTT
ncbi:hypothetical protein WN943_003581 [Citrus x changshan-huyou]